MKSLSQLWHSLDSAQQCRASCKIFKPDSRYGFYKGLGYLSPLWVIDDSNDNEIWKIPGLDQPLQTNSTAIGKVLTEDGLKSLHKRTLQFNEVKGMNKKSDEAVLESIYQVILSQCARAAHFVATMKAIKDPESDDSKAFEMFSYDSNGNKEFKLSYEPSKEFIYVEKDTRPAPSELEQAIKNNVRKIYLDDRGQKISSPKRLAEIIKKEQEQELEQRTRKYKAESYSLEDMKNGMKFEFSFAGRNHWTYALEAATISSKDANLKLRTISGPATNYTNYRYKSQGYNGKRYFNISRWIRDPKYIKLEL